MLKQLAPNDYVKLNTNELHNTVNCPNYFYPELTVLSDLHSVLSQEQIPWTMSSKWIHWVIRNGANFQIPKVEG